MEREIEFKTGKHIIARFLPGADIHEEIKDLCIKHDIKAAYIPMCIGGVKDPEIINPDPTGTAEVAKPDVKKYASIMEFSAMGTVALDAEGNYMNHLHIVAGGDRHELVVMGHLVSGEVAILTEIVIIECDGIEAMRDIDPGIFPLPLLFFKHKN